MNREIEKHRKIQSNELSELEEKAREIIDNESEARRLAEELINEREEECRIAEQRMHELLRVEKEVKIIKFDVSKF